MASGSTLVAGVGTLLLALGVGVLIGHTANSTPARVSAAPAPQVITVGGGGGGGGAAAGGAAATKAAKTKIVSPKIHISKVVAAKAAAAAGAVLGGAAPKNPTVTVGQSCSAGTAGCTGGKFTGSFFGP
jgi:hypothetical protein